MKRSLLNNRMHDLRKKKRSCFSGTILVGDPHGIGLFKRLTLQSKILCALPMFGSERIGRLPCAAVCRLAEWLGWRRSVPVSSAIDLSDPSTLCIHRPACSTSTLNGLRAPLSIALIDDRRGRLAGARNCRKEHARLRRK